MSTAAAEDFIGTFRATQVQNILPITKWVNKQKENILGGFVVTLFFGLPALRGKEILDGILDASLRRTSGSTSLRITVDIRW